MTSIAGPEDAIFWMIIILIAIINVAAAPHPIFRVLGLGLLVIGVLGILGNIR